MSAAQCDLVDAVFMRPEENKDERPSGSAARVTLERHTRGILDDLWYKAPQQQAQFKKQAAKPPKA